MNTLPSSHPKYRTKLCRNFASGSCQFGPKCSFVHAVPRISPPSFSLVPHLFYWNVLLPQLLALSNQRSPPKMMPPPLSSPSRSQGPHLVDEDLSPSSSLLLSTSDCTSVEQALPQTKRPSRRRKYPCRHFVRTGGWCPAGEQCRFLHDVAALPSARKIPPLDTVTYGEQERPISGGCLTGLQRPSPPIAGQGHLEPPRYLAPEMVERPHQPFYWPNYTWQPYYPTTTNVMSMPATAALQHSHYTPAQSQAQTMPPQETETNSHLPLGAYEMNGTIYFPASVPPAPAPYPVPAHPAPYNHAIVPPPTYPYGCYVPPPLPVSHYDVVLRPHQDQDPRSCFDPFASDPMVLRDLPVIPQREDDPSLAVPSGALVYASPTTETMTQDKDKDKPTAGTQEHGFPYQPPKNQRVGHARRISVNIKKPDQGQARANSG